LLRLRSGKAGSRALAGKALLHAHPLLQEIDSMSGAVLFEVSDSLARNAVAPRRLLPQASCMKKASFMAFAQYPYAKAATELIANVHHVFS
jgi:hypothetical protein